MRRATFLLLALGMLFGVGWGLTAGDFDPDPAPQPQALPGPTPEEARTALLARMRSADPGELKHFAHDRLASEPLVSRPDTSLTWGPFAFRLIQREYRFDRSFGDGPGVSWQRYRGTFELRDGAWTATRPRVEWEALGHE